MCPRSLFMCLHSSCAYALFMCLHSLFMCLRSLFMCLRSLFMCLHSLHVPTLSSCAYALSSCAYALSSCARQNTHMSCLHSSIVSQSTHQAGIHATQAVVGLEQQQQWTGDTREHAWNVEGMLHSVILREWKSIYIYEFQHPGDVIKRCSSQGINCNTREQWTLNTEHRTLVAVRMSTKKWGWTCLERRGCAPCHFLLRAENHIVRLYFRYTNMQPRWQTIVVMITREHAWSIKDVFHGISSTENGGTGNACSKQGTRQWASDTTS